MNIVYRASELGGCSRFLIGKRMGYTEMPPPENFQRYFDRGNEVEEAAVAEYEQGGYEITRRQETVEVKITDTISVVGHIDGVIQDAETRGSRHLWECKRVTPDVFNSFKEHGWEAKYHLLDRYKWQTSSYMVGTGLELWFDVVALIDGAYHTHTLHQELPFYSELQIKTRVLMLEAAAQAGELGDTCDKPNYPCPLYYLPGHNDEKDDTDEVVSGLARAVIDAKADSERAAKKEKDLRGQLLAAMGERKKLRLEVATVSVQKSQRTVTDYEKMALDGWDLKDYQRKEDGEDYVRVTPRKGVVKKDEDGTDTDES